jgi:protein-S-isoprenylcysteine O-methyltransferase Ste14
MNAIGALSDGAGCAPQRLTLPCPSSWISWASYWSGFVLAAGPGANGLESLDALEVAVLLLAAAAFFASVILIQRHMKLSLLANSFGSPNALVTSGPFEYSRNPIYVAFMIPIVSLAILSPAVSLLTASVYILAMDVFIIRREEGLLECRFGETYNAYKARVPRWIVCRQPHAAAAFRRRACNRQKLRDFSRFPRFLHFCYTRNSDQGS